MLIIILNVHVDPNSSYRSRFLVMLAALIFNYTQKECLRLKVLLKLGRYPNHILFGLYELRLSIAFILAQNFQFVIVHDEGTTHIVLALL